MNDRMNVVREFLTFYFARLWDMKWVFVAIAVVSVWFYFIDPNAVAASIIRSLKL